MVRLGRSRDVSDGPNMLKRVRRSRSGDEEPPVACRELRALITDYLEGALSGRQTKKIERHLQRCKDCRAALAQLREVVALAGQLSSEDIDALDPDVRSQLFAAFSGAFPATEP